MKGLRGRSKIWLCRTATGDIFEIEARDFGLPLRNPLEIEQPVQVAVKAL